MSFTLLGHNIQDTGIVLCIGSGFGQLEDYIANVAIADGRQTVVFEHDSDLKHEIKDAGCAIIHLDKISLSKTTFVKAVSLKLNCPVFVFQSGMNYDESVLELSQPLVLSSVARVFTSKIRVEYPMLQVFLTMEGGTTEYELIFDEDNIYTRQVTNV